LFQIITSGFIVAWLSQKFAREKHPRWFERFNYVLSAALDAGSSINALTCFLLTVSVLKVVPMPHWAGNPVKDSEHCTAGT
jgi:OPT oligopeptide transporter protein